LIACSYEDFKRYCSQKALRIVAASPHAKAFHHQTDLRGPLAIVLGSEAWGLSEKWAAAEAVKIPMNGIADSLNVSVAAAVLMYEALRQRS
jgi:TrmH family RNA methyltransferase